MHARRQRIHAHTHACTYIRKHVCRPSAQARTHTHMRAQAHTHIRMRAAHHARTYKSTYAGMRTVTYSYTGVHRYTLIHACVPRSMHVHTHLRTHVRAGTQGHPHAHFFLLTLVLKPGLDEAHKFSNFPWTFPRLKPSLRKNFVKVYETII